MRRRHSFTLVELLVVMGIIVILAAMVVGGAKVARRKAAEAKTLARMKKLELALEQYHQQRGFFPRDGSYPDLLGSLSKISKSRAVLDDWNGDTADYKDAFHQEFRYQCPGTHNPEMYDLSSAGADRNFGTGDDITNWTQQ